MNVLERIKLNFRSFTVLQFHRFFVRCRRTYVLNNTYFLYVNKTEIEWLKVGNKCLKFKYDKLLQIIQ